MSSRDEEIVSAAIKFAWTMLASPAMAQLGWPCRMAVSHRFPRHLPWLVPRGARKKVVEIGRIRGYQDLVSPP